MNEATDRDRPEGGRPARIELKGLAKRFGSLWAVKELDLSVPAGEVFCFLGPNGAGKTTTIKMLCGLLRPTAGTILLEGRDPSREGIEARRLIGYIPDQPYLYDRLTILEYVLFAADLYSVPRALARSRFDEFEELLGLGEYRHALIGDLSHGLRQRLVYAAAFVHDPLLLLVDEPFVGLDPYSIRTIRRLLRERAAAGMTVFLTTHILALAEDLADRIGILHQGRLAALGTMSQLRTHEQDDLEDVFLSITRDQGA